MTLDNNPDSFLSLVRLGIGHDAPLPQAIDWKAMKALAYRQGLSAVVWDGVRSLRERGQLAAEIAPDEAVAKEWSKYVAESYERRYADYVKRIGQLAWFYNLLTVTASAAFSVRSSAAF